MKKNKKVFALYLTVAFFFTVFSFGINYAEASPVTIDTADLNGDYDTHGTQCIVISLTGTGACNFGGYTTGNLFTDYAHHPGGTLPDGAFTVCLDNIGSPTCPTNGDYTFSVNILNGVVLNGSRIVSWLPIATSTPTSSPINLSVTYYTDTDIGSSTPNLVVGINNFDTGQNRIIDLGKIATTTGTHTLAYNHLVLEDGLYNYSMTFDNSPNVYVAETSNFIINKTSSLQKYTNEINDALDLIVDKLFDSEMQDWEFSDKESW